MRLTISIAAVLPLIVFLADSYASAYVGSLSNSLFNLLSSKMHDFLHLFVVVACLISFYPCPGSSVYTLAGIPITSPPAPLPTKRLSEEVFRRQASCSYGVCGTSCLSQGAFCCGPAGTSATSPFCNMSPLTQYLSADLIESRGVR